jgi:LacI family transcriptional regulator
MAAEHLLERGFTNFAYCGFKNMPWSIERCEAFDKKIRKAGFTVRMYLSPVSQISSLIEHLATKLPKWLHSLRFPTGVMCCNDDMGRILLDVCKSARINVPEQIAVVGVDNDDLVCELTDPPLSSVSLNSRVAGFEAAVLLNKLMNGTKMAGQVIIHRPSFVATRQSSDVYAIRDKEVAAALAFIRTNVRKPILVSDVARSVSLSERQLFTKFRNALSRSVHDEIKRARIEQISKLLTETDLSITEIAYNMGFTGTEHISRYFKQISGLCLKTYRSKTTG